MFLIFYLLFNDYDGRCGSKVPANSVPAAAVIQKVQVLFIMIGRKRYVGGLNYN